MAENAPNPTHHPKPDAELEPRGYVLVIHFHPPINLAKGGYKFAGDISEYLEARSVSLEPNQWQFSQPLGAASGGLFQLTVTPTMAQFEINHPTHRLDWLASRCKMVLEVFSETFKPKMLLLSETKVIGTMQIDGDAREFLVKHVSSLDPKRFSMLKRPIHIFGIRVFCPPYKKDVKKGKKTKAQVIPWQVDIKAESLGEDPTKLYLEANAQWPVPSPWEAPKIQEVVDHMKLVSDYLANDVMEFLKNPDSGETT